MSRDWTPRECLAAEKLLNGKTWFDISKEMRLISKDGKETPMLSSDFCAFIQQFDYLKRIGADAVRPLWIKYEDDCKEVLQYVEDCLAAYIERRERIESWVCDWFDGELDPGFYYAEHNNERFREEAEALESRLVADRNHSAPIPH